VQESAVIVTTFRKIAFPCKPSCAIQCAMNFFTRLLLALCVFVGMANGMLHKGSHDAHDECAAQHSHSHGGTHDSHDDGDGTNDEPHHHDCCHFPSAVCALEGLSASIAFQPILVEISADVPLRPEDPVFALDKPPLI
jgi:ABC-type nickel/cobalt efflux system permease component RcnA